MALAQRLPVQTADRAQGQQQLIPGVLLALECPKPELPKQLPVHSPVVAQVIAGREGAHSVTPVRFLSSAENWLSS